MTKKNILIGSAMMILSASFFTLLGAQEPSKPDINVALTAEKEVKIRAFKNLNIKGAMDKLKDADFIVDENYLNKSIDVAFKDRKSEAITAALDLLKQPKIEIVDNKKVNRTEQIYIAKKILQSFPEDSMPRISGLFNASTSTMKANLIGALGKMSSFEARNMLIAALDDKTFYDEVSDPEMEGEPMRICDMAYNQLVLRYQVPDVLRTIGPAHTLEQRDYHIEILKTKI